MSVRIAPLDRGSASIIVIGAAIVLALLGAVAVTAAAGVGAAARAQGAADLAALAAASRARDDLALGRLDARGACDLAHAVARANGAAVVECSVTPSGIVRVDARVTLSESRGPLGVVRTAFAGPAGARERAG